MLKYTPAEQNYILLFDHKGNQVEKILLPGTSVSFIGDEYLCNVEKYKRAEVYLKLPVLQSMTIVKAASSNDVNCAKQVVEEHVNNSDVIVVMCNAEAIETVKNEHKAYMKTITDAIVAVKKNSVPVYIVANKVNNIKEQEKAGKIKYMFEQNKNLLPVTSTNDFIPLDCSSVIPQENCDQFISMSSKITEHMVDLLRLQFQARITALTEKFANMNFIIRSMERFYYGNALFKTLHNGRNSKGLSECFEGIGGKETNTLEKFSSCNS